jgi:hypothetical protein
MKKLILFVFTIVSFQLSANKNVVNSTIEKNPLTSLMFYREWMGAENYVSLLQKASKKPCQTLLEIPNEQIANHNIFARRFFHTYSVLGCEANGINKLWSQYLDNKKINIYSVKIILDNLEPKKYGSVIRSSLEKQNTVTQNISKSKRDKDLLSTVKQITTRFL